MPFNGDSLFRTTSGTIKAAPGAIMAVTYVDVGAAGTGYVNIRDGGAAGTIKWRIGSGGQNVASSVNLAPEGIKCNTDIYCEFVGGVTPGCSVEFV
jgi:hypothetical protein